MWITVAHVFKYSIDSYPNTQTTIGFVRLSSSLPLRRIVYTMTKRYSHGL